MRSLYLFLFGYRTADVPKDVELQFVNLLLKLGIGVRLKRGRAFLSLGDLKKIENSPFFPSVKLSSVRGAFPWLLSLRNRYFTAFALFLAVLFNLILSGTVLDVRISGNDGVPDYKIREELNRFGLYTGSRFSSLDTEQIELKLIECGIGIAWVNINRRGNVAYVEVVEEKGIGENISSVLSPSNIVASCDAVIAEITVKAGKAHVKVGDVVKKGDILISGVIENDTGTSLLHAEGTVLGTVVGDIATSVPKSEEVKSTVGFETSELRLNILNFSANIFKNYRNSDSECDIIIDNEYLCLLNGVRLPIGYTRVLSPRVSVSEVTYTESEIILLAYKRHNTALSALLSSGEVLKISTNGDFDGEKYTVSSSVTYITSIGEEREIELSPSK